MEILRKNESAIWSTVFQITTVIKAKQGQVSVGWSMQV